jgi:hypothetical protein
MTYVGSPDWTDPTQPQGLYDRIGQIILTAGETIQSQNLPTMTGEYHRYFIIGQPDVTCQVTVTVTDGPNGITYQASQYQVANSPVYFSIPAFGILGNDSSDWEVTQSVASGATGSLYQLAGCRYYPEGSPLNGRPPLQNSLAATWGPVMGASTVIATPGISQRILLGAVVLPNVATAAGISQGRLLGTIGGVQTPLATITANTTGGQGSTMSFGDGILLDQNTGITQNFSAALNAVTNGAVFYDVVF